jgi:hypothetical protein
MLCIGRQVCLLAAAADGSWIRGERIRRDRRRGQWRIVVSGSQSLAARDVRARSGFRRSTAHEFSFARVGEIAQGERVFRFSLRSRSWEQLRGLGSRNAQETSQTFREPEQFWFTGYPIA